MSDSAQYKIKETLHTSVRTRVFRATRLSDQQPVVLKTLNAAKITPDLLSRFRREYEIDSSLNSGNDGPHTVHGVAAVYGFESSINPTILMEDTGGDSLDRQDKSHWSLTEFLSLAIQLADTLGQIHSRQIIHKDINPSNIIYNPETGIAKIIDFGLSTLLPRENVPQVNVNVLEGTIAYISPEQSGRINRPVDYRTDFYSLGVTFYELLSGTLPFRETDPLSLIHSHLAKQPVPLHDAKPGIPVALSSIVMKLLAKNAGDRYQSAFGLKTDLVECQRQWQAGEVIHEFPLAQRDVSDRFQISQSLFGRDQEIQQLLSAFERARHGSSEIVLVSGEAGIGKTSLVNELQIPIARQNGMFISGKYVQAQNQTPYSGLVAALRSLIQQLLSESEESLAVIRNKILEMLGVNGQIIISLVPEAIRVLGTQPPLQPLSAKEEQNRFNLTLQNFLESFLSPDRPLVLFFDDLQWADAASSSFLQRFAASTNLHHVILIASVRSHEITSEHPLQGSFQKFVDEGNRVTRIDLSPLKLDNLIGLLAQSLNCTVEESTSLAEIVLAKTGGNPFFINEFLRGIHNDGLIQFHVGEGRWVWDIHQIQTRQLTDNVLEIMSAKIKELPDDTRRMLEYAACIGYEFGLSTLASLSHYTRPETAAILRHSLASSVVIPLTQNYIFAEQAETESDVRYSFSHVGIQQGIYSTLSESERSSLHWQIGQRLLDEIPEDQREGRVFELVNHLNLGSALLQTLSERLELTKLNLLAGQKAQASAAHESAFKYLKAGLSLLIRVPDFWREQYELAFALYTTCAEAAYFVGDIPEKDRLLEETLKHAKPGLDQSRVHEINLQAHFAQGDRSQAVRAGLDALSCLGVNLPYKPTTMQILMALMKIRILLAGKSADDLVNLSLTEEPRIKRIFRIVRLVFTPAYSNSPTLVPMLLLKTVELTLKYGNGSISGMAFAGYGFLLTTGLGDIKGGSHYGLIGLRLAGKLRLQREGSSAKGLYATILQFWTEPLRNTLELLMDSYQSSRHLIGDYVEASNSLLVYCYHSLWAGRPLPELEAEMSEYSRLIQQMGQFSNLDNIRFFHQVALNFMGASDDPCRIVGIAFNAEAMLPKEIELNNRSLILGIYHYGMILNYHFDHYKTALEHSPRAKEYMDGGTGSYSLFTYPFYDSLVRLALWNEASPRERRAWSKIIAASQKNSKKWARFAPANHQHKYLLIEAELARVRGEYGKARELYDESIALARQNLFLNEEALAYELAGKFYVERGLKELAGYYLGKALQTYHQWGAEAKVQLLETKYAEYMQPRRGVQVVRSMITTSNDTAGEVTSAIDFTSVLKASQALSGEIVLNKLLASLLEIMIENAGAERGWLLREQAGAWMIEAQKEQGRVEVFESSVADPQRLPLSIFSYVSRTQEVVVLDDASQSGQFARDPYIMMSKPKSVLCMPVVQQGTLTGLLYLENNLTTNAFTPERLEVMRVLSSQAAISIANARLYADLRTNEERYRTLFEDSRDAIFVMTTEATIVDINQATLDLFGYTRDEMLKLGLSDIGVPMDAFVAFQRVMEEQGSARDYEVKLTRKDGTEMDALLTATLRRDETGKPVAYQGILRDITERKRAERLLEEYSHNLEHMVEERTTEAKRARKDAEDANAAKSIFLASMSHEIRTPMNGIIGMTGLLLGTELTNQQRDFADVIRNSGETLLTIINDILDFSKIESGKMELEHLPFNLRECIESALDLVVTRAAEHHLDLACIIEDDVPEAISGDVTRLRQILLNLLSNAVKFTEQGEVVITVSRDTESEEMGLRNYLHFTVRDTGIGIPRERTNRLFESFSQVDASTTRKYGGTGLGLAISKRLVELMGGEIKVESEGIPGKGTTFHFTIVGEPAQLAAAAPAPDARHLLEGKRVLIVDDNDTNRRIFKLQTEKWGMITHDTALPNEALAILKRRETFDLIVLDMFMPEMDGAMLAKEIREHDSSTPLLLFSSLGLRDIGLDKGLFDAYLSKPLKPSLLFDTLIGIFDRGRSAPLTAPKTSLFDPGMGERHPLRILLAEDNAVNQKLAMRMLEQMGYRADLASNGIEAIESLERQPYDVVFMDVQMPEMDGLEATRKIRVMSYLSQPRIIAMTANAMQGDREMCLEAGMNDYISKPIRVNELVDALMKVERK